MSHGKGHWGWRPLKPPEKAHPLVRFLYDECNRQQVSIRSVSEQSGVSESIINLWRTQGEPRLSNIEACLNVLGFTILTPTRKE